MNDLGVEQAVDRFGQGVARLCLERGHGNCSARNTLPGSGTDWLGPMIAMIFYEPDHRLKGRSGPACAKYADALRRVSFSCFGSRTVRSSAFTFSALSASRHNPGMNAFAERLKAKGKSAKQVIIAIARKLIERVSTVRARTAKWIPDGNE
ncbi:MAG: hypothetical protein COC12_04850 [Rhodobacteraceae bacterium]|nr:MAG: hypothetical protein COC12_04850 [Paracoccaceae bacterium]